jgi:hypothetical protein
MAEPLVYSRSIHSLATGSSLGNMHAFVRCNKRTDLLGFWLAADNQYYLGAWEIRITANGTPAEPTHTIFRPESQTTVLTAHGAVVEQTLFLPVFPRGEEHPAAERSVIVQLRIHNERAEPAELTVRNHLVFPGVQTEDFTKQPPEDQKAKEVVIDAEGGVCIATTVGRVNECRVFGADRGWTSVKATPSSLTLTYIIRIEGYGDLLVPFRLSASPYGQAETLAGFTEVEDTEQALARTELAMACLRDSSLLFTPDPLVNRGLQWAKVNMMRVAHRYRVGEAFTNDPPQDIVVIRDLAWYTLGMDALFPELSRKMLEVACASAVMQGGKLAEYFHANEQPPALYDYHLNINDDTPLLVWALAHHGWATGDHAFLGQVYPTMEAACDWILSQITDGLVRCTATGTNVWGICSWRNIIDEYSLVGAVTEINAECFAALSATAAVASQLGVNGPARRFSDAAQALRREMNVRLRSGRSEMYLLNIDNDGTEHHDLTGDLVFPVLTGVADERLGKTILERLTAGDFWTPYGVRTVPPGDPLFDPDRGYQLVGGVWPNLTAWVGYSLRATWPARVAEAMGSIYRIVEEEIPAEHGYVVPGEFPERLHGTTFESKGMTLSPWMPPTYMWLGVEGLLGVRLTASAIEVNPAVPESWRWLVVRNLPVPGGLLCGFLFDGILYLSMQVSSKFPVITGNVVPSRTDSPGLESVVLEVENNVIVFVAGSAWAEGHVAYARGDTWRSVPVRLDSSGAAMVRTDPATITS